MKLHLEVYASELLLTDVDIEAGVEAKWKLYNQQGTLIGILQRMLDRSFRISVSNDPCTTQSVSLSTLELKVLDYTP